MEKNQVLVRLENIADLFDVKAQTYSVNLEQFARDLYKFANQKPDEADGVDIQEVTLSANQPIYSIGSNTQWQAYKPPAPKVL